MSMYNSNDNFVFEIDNEGSAPFSPPTPPRFMRGVSLPPQSPRRGADGPMSLPIMGSTRDVEYIL